MNEQDFPEHSCEANLETEGALVFCAVCGRVFQPVWINEQAKAKEGEKK